MTSVEQLGVAAIDTKQFEDAERLRIENFQCLLGRNACVQPIGIELDFDERLPVARAIDQFYTYEKRAAPTLYVEPGYKRHIEADEISFSPRRSRGGRNSAHGVFFGDLDFGESGSTAVAVKPFEGDNFEQAMLKDHFNGRAIRELGLFSLQPIGVVLNGGDCAYSITLLEETLTTLDSIDWTKFYPDTSKDPGMSQIWSQVARQVAMFHAIGSNSHGDLAGRNIAVTGENYAFPIDWERAHISLTRARDAEVRYEFSHPDLAMIVETFTRSPGDTFKAGLGILNEKGDDWWGSFCDLFFDEYYATRYQLAESENNKQELEEVESELEVLRASLHLDMQMARDYYHTTIAS